MNYGINGMRTLKDWAGVQAMLMEPITQLVDDLDLEVFDLVSRPTFSIELPSLVMGEQFVFLYSAGEVKAELERLAEACKRSPGCVIKWVRHASQDEVEKLWKEDR